MVYVSATLQKSFTLHDLLCCTVLRSDGSCVMSDRHSAGHTCVCNMQHKGAEISYDKSSLLADGVEPMAASQQLAETESAAGSSTNQDSSAVNGISLSIPYQLRSADDLHSPFTNYVRGYSGLLDYIWYEPQRMKVERAIPLPSFEEVKAFIPSERFPSDHLSVRSSCRLLLPLFRCRRNNSVVAALSYA